MNFPPPDAVQEVRILTHNFAAEYGRNPGSQVNVVSRAGTNDIHGSAWEFLRNDAMNARNFFSSRVPALKQNQFGAAAGGPVIKDKVFVFGTYQGLRDRREAQTVQAFVPSAAELNGDFTASGVTLTNAIDPITIVRSRTLQGAPASPITASLRDASAPLRRSCLAMFQRPPAARSIHWLRVPATEICTCCAVTGIRASGTESMAAGMRTGTPGPRRSPTAAISRVISPTTSIRRLNRFL